MDKGCEMEELSNDPKGWKGKDRRGKAKGEEGCSIRMVDYAMCC